MRDGKIYGRKKKDNQKDDEKSKLERIKDDVIYSIYGVFYILLKNNESSLWKFGIILFIQFLQVLSYSFELSLGKVWKSESIIEYVTSFLSTFRVVYWLEKLSWDVYIIVYYVCIFLIFLIIIDFIYVAYSYRNRKFAFVWPVQALRYSCKMIITIFYIPMLELFLSFSRCSTINGVIYHDVFKEVVCFNGIHILHVVISYFIIIIFVALTIAITQCFYEFRIGRDPLSKTKSTGNQLMLITKFAYVFSFTFFRDHEHFWFLGIVLFIGSAIVFSVNVNQRPYYNEKTQRLYNVLNGMFLWTNTVLLFSCFVYYIDFTANLAVFILGIPFVIMLIVNIPDKRKEYLLTGTNRNFNNAEQLLHYISYYLHLIDTKGKLKHFHMNLKYIDESRDSALTLKGYVNYHSEYCLLEACPLKNFKKQQQKDLKKQYGQFGQNQTQYTAITNKNQITNLESHPLLLQQAKILFTQGIKKFPKDCALKIEYAQFMLYRMHNKKDALKELMIAEKSGPSFEQQFMIFRYRHIIEDELHEGSDSSGGGLDYVAAINFENYFSQFKSMIEKSALLHFEFWNHLMDDSPDLARLSEQGTRINVSIQSVEDQWKKLTQQSTQTPKALRLYASFLIEILNDKELGNEQLQKAKEAAVARVNFDFNNMHEDSSDMSSFAPDGSPCVYISGEQDRLGIITQCNMSVCRFFGYSKKEDLINHDVEVLMPKIYAKYHKKFLEQALQKPPDLLSNKERQVFGKHFSGFVFPLWLSVKNLPSFLSGRQFVATFKMEKNGINKNVAHLILDKNREVIDISSSCIQMLEIDLQKFQKLKAKFDIQTLLPTLFGANYYQFQNKAGYSIEYMYPQLVEIDKNKNIKNDGDGDDDDGNNQNNDDNYYDDGQDDGGNGGGNNYRGLANQFNISMIEEEDDALLSHDGMNMQRRNNNMMADEQNSYLLKKPHLTKNVEKIMEVDGEDEDMGDDSNDQGDGNGSGRGGFNGGNQYDYEIIPKNERKAIFNCNMIEIHFETQNLENPNPGYYVRLETSSENAKEKGQTNAKIQKNLKQSAFQFSYDPIYKRFCRELRDKENKDILQDKNFLQLKKLKEQYLQQLKNNAQQVISSKVHNMTYMTYLSKFQKWVEKGQQGSVLDVDDGDDSDGSSSHGSADHDDNDTDEHTNTNKNTKNPNTNGTQNQQQDLRASNIQTNILPQEVSDFSKFLPGEGSGKDFLKTEIERMINVLRKKQECSEGVRVFRRVDPGQKLNASAMQNHPGIGQSGRYEETQFSVASLFGGRQNDKMASDLDDEYDHKDGDGDSERDSRKNNDNMKNTIKSRKAFQMTINDKAVPPAIKRLSRIANIILLCLLVLAIVDYSINYTQIKETITNFNVIENAQKRVSEILKVCYNTRSMIMLNLGVLKNYYGYSTRDAFISGIKQDLLSSLNALYDIQNGINLSQLDVSDEHQALLDDKQVKLYFKQDSSGSIQALQFSLTESILQIQSSIFTVSNLQLNSFNEQTNEDVFFLMYNSFEDFFAALIKSRNLYVNELKDRADAKTEAATIIFILSIIALVTVVIILIPVITSVNQQKDKVLSLFCDIDDSSIRLLSQRCEKFVNKIQSSEENANDDGMDSNEDLEQMYAQKIAFEQEDDDYSGLMGTSGKRRKSSKNNTKTKTSFYFKFVQCVLIVEAYYIYNYVMYVEFRDGVKIQVDKFNITTTVEPYYWYAVNIQREMLFNQTRSIRNTKSFIQASRQPYLMHQLSTDLKQSHLKDTQYLDEDYLAQFNHVMVDDLCPELVSDTKYFNNNITQCRNFTYGISQQGLSLMITNMVRASRLQLSQSQLDFSNQTYLNTLINQQETFDICKFIIFMSFSLFIDVIQNKFVQNFMRKLVTTFSKTLQESLDSSIQNRIFLLVLFLILLLLAYVAMWLPLVNSLTQQIYKTKLMLMIIPLEILMRMKNVGKVLQSQNFIQEKSNSRGSGRGSKGDSGRN